MNHIAAPRRGWLGRRLALAWVVSFVVLAVGSARASHIKGYDLSHTISKAGTVTFVYRAYHVNNLRFAGSSAPSTGIRYLQFGDGQSQFQPGLEVTPAFANCLRDADGKCRIEYSDCAPPGDDARLCDTATVTRVFTHAYTCTSPATKFSAFITRDSRSTGLECCRADYYRNIPDSNATTVVPENAVFPCCTNPLGDPNSGPVFSAPPVFNSFRNVPYLNPLGASDLDGDPLTLGFLMESPISGFSCLSIPCATPVTPSPITLTAHDPCQSPSGAIMGFAPITRLDWNQPRKGLGCDQTRLGFYGVGTAVTDTCGATAEREFRLELLEEPITKPPVLTLAPHLPPGLVDICIDRDVVVIDVTASDPDVGDTVTLSVAPPGMANATFASTAGNPATGVFTFAPRTADLQLGTHGFTFSARDNGAPQRTTQESIQIIVIDCNSNLPPLADAGGPYTEECGGQPTSVQLDGTRSSDPEMDPLTFKWFTTCSGASFDGDTLARPILTLSGNPPCPIDCFVTLRVTDPFGGSSSDTDEVTIEDTLAPVPSATPGATTAACDAVPPAVAVSGSDDCDPMVTAVFDEQKVNSACADTYELERSWTLGDACGNRSVVAQRVTVEDRVAPVFSGLPVAVAVMCAAEVPAAPGVGASDNCDPAVVVAFSENPIDVVCPNRFRLVREWQAADRCGNPVTAARTVVVNDVLAPVLSGVPPAATVECDAVPAPPVVTANDNCSTGLAPRFNQVRFDGSCPDSYSLQRLWSARDECANEAVATQALTVVDRTRPVLLGVPADITVECDAVPAPAVVTAADNCDPGPIVTLRERRIAGPCDDTYTLLREWSAIDRCGNLGTGIQRVTVRDTVAPIARAVLEPLPPTAASSACSSPSSGTFKVVCAGSDNCDPSPSLRARLRVASHDVAGDSCSLRIALVDVLCEEVVELRTLAPPCPARGPVSAPPPVVITGGRKVVSGESMVLEVLATDRCGNEGRGEYDPAREPALCPLLEPPPDPPCRVPLCGRCAATVLSLPPLSVAVTGEGCDRDSAAAAALAAAGETCVGLADAGCSGSCRDARSICARAAAPAGATLRCAKTTVLSCWEDRGYRCDLTGTVDCGCACRL